MSNTYVPDGINFHTRDKIYAACIAIMLQMDKKQGFCILYRDFFTANEHTHNMTGLAPADKQFLEKVDQTIKDHLSNEQFGVSELAGKINMSRSNLLRKIKKLTGLSASQYLRKIRLEEALVLLRTSGMNVTEVSFSVGFNSTSYFIKCFHEHFGYPPGEFGKHEEKEKTPGRSSSRASGKWLIPAVAGILLLVMGLIFLPGRFRSSGTADKSIAVLPFLNDSNDSSNIYFINGMMESILSNLQKIEDLRVISRTSVEHYRNNPKLLNEIARELNVSYIVEGSGQKQGDKVMLNIQLIHARDDRHLWAGQYSEEIEDVFELQSDIAKKIADEVEAIIKPEEEKRIEKVPTENLEAYDLYLKGRDLMFSQEESKLLEGISYIKEAIALDKDFALACASVSISYFLLDLHQTQKQYLEETNAYADQALLLDPQLAQSLIAKALYFINTYQFDQSLDYLEKALEYNPNSLLAVNILSDFYTNVYPDSRKYLEYAIRGLRLENLSRDSVTSSFTYLHIGNAFIQSGFTEEAERYLDKSLEYNPSNLYTQYVLAYVQYVKHRDLNRLSEQLYEVYLKDTTRLDVLQELAKSYYFNHSFEKARYYYSKFTDLEQTTGKEVYPAEDFKIAAVYHLLGQEEEASHYINKFRAYTERDQSIYRHLNYFIYYVYQGDFNKALPELELFSKETNFHYWTLVFLEKDPMMNEVKDLPEYREIMNRINVTFRKHKKEMKDYLESQHLI